MELKEIKRKSLREIYGDKKIDKWLDKYQTLENDKVQDWILGKIRKYSAQGKEESRFNLVNYVSAFEKYCHYVAGEEGDIVEIPDKLLEEDVAHRNHRFMNYIRWELKRGKYAESSILNNYQSRIMSFFSYHNSDITEFLEAVKSGTKLKEVNLTKDMIAKIINGINLIDYRIAIKWMSLCGFRISDVLRELVSTKNGYDAPKYQIEYSEEREIHFIRNFKTGKEQVQINYVFIPKELERMLLVAYGDLCGGDLRKLDLRETLMNRIRKDGKYKNRHISRHALDNRIKEIAEKLGIIVRLEDREDGDPVYNKSIRLHGFRAYFCSNVRTTFPRMNWLTNHFEGHTNGDLSDAYNRYLKDFDWMFDKWSQFSEKTSIDVEIRDRTDEKIIEVQKENFLLKQKLTTTDKKLNAILRFLKEKAVESDMEEEEFEGWIQDIKGEDD